MSKVAGKDAALPSELERWLARVSHDLVKRLLWPARDRQDLGGIAAPSELVAQLVDDEGAAIDGGALWLRLCEEAPLAGRAESLHTVFEGFSQAVERAEAAARAGDVEGVLRLAEAFSELTRQVRAAGATTERER